MGQRFPEILLRDKEKRTDLFLGAELIDLGHFAGRVSADLLQSG